MNVYRLGNEPPVRLAAAELAKYLKAMTGRALQVRPAGAYDLKKKGIWVGPAGALADAVVLPQAVENARAGEDAIFVLAEPGHVIVTGANPRSVLFAAYRYLEELGCRWLRPGRNGERVPRARGALSRKLALMEVPSARHRCICIEGSVSREHVRDTIDYAAKRGFNAYFLQFRTSYTFFDRWYGNESKRGGEVTHITDHQAQQLRDAAKREALKRGMMLHVVGHGWTCEPFGIPGTEWAEYGGQVPASAKKHFAKVNGKRELWGGVPLNTNLCYSDPKVRTIMARAVAEYAETHPDEDVIHVWLADGVNNNCQCKGCRKARPSDFYVQILNEIDERLARKGLATRIVFLAYVDLLWAPQKQRIGNPDRFILMFAPITRSYAQSFLDKGDDAKPKIPPFHRNKLKFPSSPGVNLKMLGEWRKVFAGECVDFDYHLMWAHHYDLGQMAMARVLHKDVRDLRKLGMDGFISCQNQRASFPTGIWMHLMGKTLWDARTPFSPTVDDYLADVFGPGGRAVREYLSGLSRLFAPPVLRGEKKGEAARKRAIRSLRRVEAHVEGFTREIVNGCDSPDLTTAAAWGLLKEHAWFATACADILARSLAKDPTAAERFRDFEARVNRRLPRIHHVCDTRLARDILKRVMWQAGIEFETSDR